MTKIFATGVTGYIGGDAFHAIVNAHPEYEFTCLVRNSDKGAAIASQYPKVRLVYGDLDSSDLIAEEAARADIVCHWANADHEAGAEAIARGLASHPSSRAGYWIHTSGTGILLGSPPDKVYRDDDAGIHEVTSLPDSAPHRTVDKIVLAASSSSPNVHTAIVCPPTIYGPGRGPGNQRSHQAYELTRITLQKGHGVVVGDGSGRWTYVHVHDLSAAYLALAEAAASGGGKATWDDKGYYFTENGEYVWVDLSRAVAKECKKQGLIGAEAEEVKSLSDQEADEATPHGSWVLGGNSRARAVRAREVLGWVPKGRGLFEEVGDIVKSEARRVGAVKGHAKEAAGEA